MIYTDFCDDLTSLNLVDVPSNSAPEFEDDDLVTPSAGNGIWSTLKPPI